MLANDSTPITGQTLTITAVTQGSQGGTVAIAAGGGSVTYTPAAASWATRRSPTRSAAATGTDQATVTMHVLEYTPRSISGNLNYFKTSLGGLKVDLVGTDDFGEPVNLDTNALADGSFSFDNLAPGDYSVYAPQ